MTDRNCTPDDPFSEEKHTPGTRWLHDAHEVGEQEDGWPCGDIVTYKCKNCGHTWREELPQ